MVAMEKSVMMLAFLRKQLVSRFSVIRRNKYAHCNSLHLAKISLECSIPKSRGKQQILGWNLNPMNYIQIVAWSELETLIEIINSMLFYGINPWQINFMYGHRQRHLLETLESSFS